MVQKLTSCVVGFMPASTSSQFTTGSFALNAAPTGGTGRQLAFSFVATESVALNGVQIYSSVKTGDPSVKCSLYGDSNGAPDTGTLLDSVEVTSGWPASGNFYEFDGFIYSLTAGTRYWVVFTNTKSGSETSNYPTILFGSSNTGSSFGLQVASTQSMPGWQKMEMTDGSTWGSRIGGCSGIRLKFAGSKYDGLTVSSITAPSGTSRIYGTNIRGVLFTTPANAKFKVAGCCMALAKSGTPGDLVFKMYSSGATPGAAIATSNTIDKDSVYTDKNYYFGWFSSAVTLDASTAYRVMATTSGGDSSNAFSLVEYVMHDNAASIALAPWSACLTTSADGTTFSESGANAYTTSPFGLILDSTGEFVATSSGGGMIVNPGMSGGCRG